MVSLLAPSVVDREISVGLKQRLSNTVVSNHFHSIKSFFFSSAKSRDCDGMLSAVVRLSNLKDFFYNFCEKQISIKLFYLYQRLKCTVNYFFKIKFVICLYLLLSAS